MNNAFWVVLLGMFYAETITLEDLRWKNRVLLVFPDAEQPLALDWEITDSLRMEFEERDLLYFVFQDSLLTNSTHRFDPAYEVSLKKKYRLGSKNVCWVLIGKDGGTKVRQEGDGPNWEELFGIIDAMPMRARELQERKRP
ncbi:DUF4174 domain-containing protein [Lunatimonas salinarum]|uniref:DUF4174 domain-containing protein n=1 Tax=Lunatimonas salinarum TaxID=1774590 RepID=UPI001FD83361|nr:DUF4174 domain-containing protein [Lunatimonas salinarum]